MIFLWIVLALVILALAVSYLAFRIACVRGHEYPWEDDAQMQKKIGPSYAALVKGGVDWLRQQRPRDLYLTSYDGLRLHARWVPADCPRHYARSKIRALVSRILPGDMDSSSMPISTKVWVRLGSAANSPQMPTQMPA